MRSNPHVSMYWFPWILKKRLGSVFDSLVDALTRHGACDAKTLQAIEIVIRHDRFIPRPPSLSSNITQYAPRKSGETEKDRQTQHEIRSEQPECR